MAALDFPNSGLTTGTTYTGDNGVVYIYDGIKWVGQSSSSSGSIGPQGPSGVAGPQGPSGVAGPQGPSGVAGSSGVAGPQGPSGVAGPQGPSGVAGPQGVQGDTGPAGPTGPSIGAVIAGGAGDVPIYENTGTILSRSAALAYSTFTNTLFVGRNSSDGNLYVTRNSYDNTFGAGFTFAQHHDTADSVNFSFYRTRGSSIAQTPVVVGDDVVDIGFYAIGNNGINTGVASIGVNVESTSTGTPGARIQFFTHSGSSFAERARISSTGTFQTNRVGSLTPGANIVVQNNLIPAADVTYDLGSTSSQWRSLYVSSSTIYINRIPLTINETGTLLVNGAEVEGTVGPQGPQGVQGVAGPTGPSVQISGSFETENNLPYPYEGNTGSSYLVVGTGDLWVWSENTWTNVGQIAGPVGPAGADGVQGDVGPTGPQGDVGPTGPQGVQGDVGPTGPQGDVGPTGPQGVQGDVGPTGPQGERAQEDRLTTGSYSLVLGENGELTFPSGNLSIGGMLGSDAIVGSTGTLVSVIAQGQFGAIGLQWIDDISNIGSTTTQTQVAGIAVNAPLSSTTGTVQIVTGFTTGTTVSNTWEFGTDGSLTAPGHLLPDADLAYDLGSTSSQWRSIYVGTGTVYIGGVALGVNQDNYVTVDGNPIITINTAGNITVQGDTILTPVYVSDVAPDASVSDGNLWYNSLDGRTYVSYSGQWVDTNPVVVPKPETYLDEITIDGSTLNINGGTLTIDDTGTLLVNGSEVSGSGYGATLTASATDPGTSTGTLWFNTIEGRTYLKYNDQWVDVNPTVVPQPSTYLDEITIDGSTINMNGSTLAINTAGVLLVNGSEVTGSGHQLTSSTSAVSLASNGTVTLPEGGTITEGLVTSNPTIQLTPASPDVASQKLVIKGGGSYINTENGIEVSAYQNTWAVSDSVTFYVYASTRPNETLYWWIVPEEGGISSTMSGTVELDGGGGGQFNFTLDSDDYEFRVRVSPTNDQYDPETIGVQSLLMNPDSPSYVGGDHHLHLTTGDLTETSIFLGTDDHNVRTTPNGNIEITTPGDDTNNVWQFAADGVLTLSTASTIVGNSTDPNVYIETLSTGTTNTWAFGSDGSTTLPTDLQIIDAGVLSGGLFDGTILLQRGGKLLQIITTGTTSTAVLGWGEDEVNSGGISTIAFSATGAEITVGNVTSGTNVWAFGHDGSITFPDSTVQTTAWTGTVAYSSITGAPAEFNTGTLVAQAVSATTATYAGYAYSFNTGTLVATAVTALNWAGGQINTTSTFIGSGSASSTNTGVLRVQGGAGISGNLYANTIYSGDGYFRGPAGYGQLQLASGGELYLPSNLVISSGGLIKGPGSSTHIGLLSGTGGAVKFYGTATIAATNTATSTTTGALTVAGGVGVGGNLYAGGYVAQAALPAFRVYGAGTTNNLTSTQNTTGVLNGNNYVVDYNQGSHLSTSTGVFTAPVAGLYQINVVARNAGYGAGISQVSVVKNRTVSNAIQVMVEWASTSTMNHAGGSTVAKLAVGDTLELKVYAGEINFDLNDNWSVAFLG